MKVYLLTTVDNPFDPYDDFDEWYRFDMEKGYDTSGYLARIAKTSPSLSEIDNQKEIKRAIDEIIKLDFRFIYRRIEKEVDEQQHFEFDMNEIENGFDLEAI